MPLTCLLARARDAMQVEQAEERKRQRAFSGSSATSAIDEALEKLRLEVSAALCGAGKQLQVATAA